MTVSLFGNQERADNLLDIACGAPWGQSLSDIPTHDGRMAELTRRYHQFIATEDQCRRDAEPKLTLPGLQISAALKYGA